MLVAFFGGLSSLLPPPSSSQPETLFCVCWATCHPTHTKKKKKKRKENGKKKSRGCQRPWRRWPTLHVISFLYSFSCHWFYCWSSSVTSSRRPITWIRRCISLKRDPRIVSLDILLLSTGLTRQVAPPKMCKFISFLFCHCCCF